MISKKNLKKGQKVFRFTAEFLKMGGISRSLGDYKHALYCFDKALRISAEEFGRGNPIFTEAMMNIGLVLERPRK